MLRWDHTTAPCRGWALAALRPSVRPHCGAAPPPSASHSSGFPHPGGNRVPAGSHAPRPLPAAPGGPQSAVRIQELGTFRGSCPCGTWPAWPAALGRRRDVFEVPPQRACPARSFPRPSHVPRRPSPVRGPWLSPPWDHWDEAAANIRAPALVRTPAAAEAGSWLSEGPSAGGRRLLAFLPPCGAPVPPRVPPPCPLGASPGRQGACSFLPVLQNQLACK